MRAAGLAVLLLSFGAATAGAQVPPAGQAAPRYMEADRGPLTEAYGAALAARVFSDEFTAVRSRYILESARGLPGFRCPTNPPVALRVVAPWRGVPDRIAWVERYVVGCEPIAVRSLLMIWDGTELRAGHLVPGRTNTDPLLQRDVMQGIVAAAATIRPAGCQDQTLVVDVRLVDPQAPAPGAWNEVWSVMQCQARGEFRVSFTPAPQGGTTWSIQVAR